MHPPPESRLRRKALLALIAALVAGVVGELGFRMALFGELSLFAPLRAPAQYADFLSEDAYWLLYWRWDGRFPPPGEPHPELGWVGRFGRGDYRHDDEASVGDRQPVLLYGDSFAYGVEGRTPFQDLLDADPAFASGQRLLNYGVGGYGSDQVMLLVERSVGLYPGAAVIVVVMPLDLDRAMLCVRVGQKPCFEAVGDVLEPRGEAIAADAEAWYRGQQPAIHSYVWRKLLFASFTPPEMRTRLRDEPALQADKEALSRLILERTVAAVRSAGTEPLFVVVPPHVPGVLELTGPPGWREQLLAETLDGLGVARIDGRALIQAAAGPELQPADWIDPGDGHPTERLNRLLAAAMRAGLVEVGG